MVAEFLLRNAGASFGVGQFGRSFGLADSTARRLLDKMSAIGLVTGQKGAQGRRVTSYQVRPGKGWTDPE